MKQHGCAETSPNPTAQSCLIFRSSLDISPLIVPNCHVRILITGLVAAGLMVGAFFLWGGYFENLLKGEIGQDPGQWDSIFVMGLLTLDVFLPIPTTAVLTSLGMAYGPWLGGVIGTLGTFCAGTTGYVLCRFLNERVARFLIGEQGLILARAFFQRSGGWVIVVSRWMIILPELLSCFAGLVRMPPREYFAALLCGVVPLSFTYSFLGSTAWAKEHPWLVLAISAAIPVGLWAGERWVFGSSNQREEAEGPDD